MRSQFPSIKLDQLVYVELDASNGGMMLTVSEEGFSFRAVSPVRTTSRTPFSFVIHGTEKLEGFGRIEWTKDDGKVAGLLFTDVTSGFLDSLRIWLAQLCAPTAPPATTHADASPEISYRPSYHTSSKRNGEASKNGDHFPAAVEPPAPQQQGFEAPVVERPVFEQAYAKETVVPPIAGLGLSFGQPLLNEPRHSNGSSRISAPPVSVAPAAVLSEWSYPQPPARSRGNGLVITAAVVCLLGLAILLYSYREVLGQSLISLGQRMSATSEPSPSQASKTPEATKPAEEVQQPPTPVPSPADTKSAAGVQPQTTSITDSRYSLRDSPAATKSDSAFQDARRNGTGDAPANKDTVASTDPEGQIRSLWSSVSQGNTSAEVALAKLYLIGGGVPKSCDQAKVLLQAAAKKGNGEAIDKLSQITKDGCP
ncbi:MAG: hypothetical protein ABLQ96_00920 [Candidatus Acidiferrum sp.]